MDHSSDTHDERGGKVRSDGYRGYTDTVTSAVTDTAPNQTRNKDSTNVESSNGIGSLNKHQPDEENDSRETSSTAASQWKHDDGPFTAPSFRHGVTVSNRGKGSRKASIIRMQLSSNSESPPQIATPASQQNRVVSPFTAPSFRHGVPISNRGKGSRKASIIPPQSTQAIDFSLSEAHRIGNAVKDGVVFATNARKLSSDSPADAATAATSIDVDFNSNRSQEDHEDEIDVDSDSRSSAPIKDTGAPRTDQGTNGKSSKNRKKRGKKRSNQNEKKGRKSNSRNSLKQQVFRIKGNVWKTIPTTTMRMALKECHLYDTLFKDDAAFAANRGTLILYRFQIKKMIRKLQKKGKETQGLQQLLEKVNAIGADNWNIRIYKGRKKCSLHFDSAKYKCRLLCSRSLGSDEDNHFIDVWLYQGQKNEDDTLKSAHKHSLLATYQTGGDNESVVMTSMGGGTSCSGNRGRPCYLPKNMVEYIDLSAHPNHREVFLQHQTQESLDIKFTLVADYIDDFDEEDVSDSISDGVTEDANDTKGEITTLDTAEGKFLVHQLALNKQGIRTKGGIWELEDIDLLIQAYNQAYNQADAAGYLTELSAQIAQVVDFSGQYTKKQIYNKLHYLMRSGDLKHAKMWGVEDTNLLIQAYNQAYNQADAAGYLTELSAQIAQVVDFSRQYTKKQICSKLGNLIRSGDLTSQHSKMWQRASPKGHSLSPARHQSSQEYSSSYSSSSSARNDHGRSPERQNYDHPRRVSDEYQPRHSSNDDYSSPRDDYHRSSRGRFSPPRDHYNNRHHHQNRSRSRSPDGRYRRVSYEPGNHSRRYSDEGYGQEYGVPTHYSDHGHAQYPAAATADHEVAHPSFHCYYQQHKHITYQQMAFQPTAAAQAPQYMYPPVQMAPPQYMYPTVQMGPPQMMNRVDDTPVESIIGTKRTHETSSQNCGGDNVYSMFNNSAPLFSTNHGNVLSASYNGSRWSWKFDDTRVESIIGKKRRRTVGPGSDEQDDVSLLHNNSTPSFLANENNLLIASNNGTLVEAQKDGPGRKQRIGPASRFREADWKVQKLKCPLQPLPYKASLEKLKASMKRSQETRNCLTMKTSATESYKRLGRVKEIMSSIATSSGQVQKFVISNP